MNSAVKQVFLALGFVLFIGVKAGIAESDRTPVTKGASGLELPRFVSLSAGKAYMRTGPGMQYPIDWEYQRSGLPLLVTEEFETWRKVTDHEGVTGWMHVQLLTGVRTAIITGGRQRLYSDPSPTSTLVMTADRGVVGPLTACVPLWCKIEIQGRKGWIRRDALFGTFKREMFD